MSRFPFFSQNFYDMINDRVDEIFDPLYEQFISLPLVSIPRNPEIERALIVNQRITSNIHAIRRQLEIESIPRRPITPLTQTLRTNTTPVQNQHYQQLQQNINQQLFNVLQLMADADQLLGLHDFPQEPLEDVKVTLQEEDFNKLHTVPFQTSDSDNKNEEHEHEHEHEQENCNICLEQYVEGVSVTKLPCKHLFHTECIKAWLCGEKINCPVCRHDVRESL
jgi:hypothetical protein